MKFINNKIRKTPIDHEMFKSVGIVGLFILGFGILEAHHVNQGNLDASNQRIEKTESIHPAKYQGPKIPYKNHTLQISDSRSGISGQSQTLYHPHIKLIDLAFYRFQKSQRNNLQNNQQQTFFKGWLKHLSKQMLNRLKK